VTGKYQFVAVGLVAACLLLAGGCKGSSQVQSQSLQEGAIWGTDGQPLDTNAAPLPPGTDPDTANQVAAEGGLR
jgi:hypothetical protein